jgi:hypothetical protein
MLIESGELGPSRSDVPVDRGADLTGLLAAAVLANVADLVTFLRASPAVVAAEETSPLPHLLGQVAGGITAKLILAGALLVILVAFRRRPRTRAALLVTYTLVGIVGAAVNLLVA